MALILTRKFGESVIIGDGLVTVTVLHARGEKVRLAIEAPKELSVHRQEVWEQIQREKAQQKETTSDATL